MKNLMDSLLNSTFNLVKRVPSKASDYEIKPAKQTKKGEKNFLPEREERSTRQASESKDMHIRQFEKPPKEVRQKMKEKFVDSFRKFVDFSVPPLAEGDRDYEEFADDPKMPLLAAVSKIYKTAKFELMTFPAAIVLLRRVFGDEREKGRQISSSSSSYSSPVERRKISVNNMHRILTVSLVIAEKFVEDVPAYISDIADSIGFKKEAVEEFEIEFLECLGYSIFVTDEEIEEVLNEWGIFTSK